MAVLKLITQAAIKAAKPAFKKYIKSNKLPFNDTNFGKYLQSKGYESPFREGSEKLKTKVWNKMKAENIPGRTTGETGLLGGEKIIHPVTGKKVRGHSKKSRAKLSSSVKPTSLENLKKWRLKQQEQAGILDDDFTLIPGGGYERLIKTEVGEPLRSDVPSIKGILSLARANILRNRKATDEILKKENLMKYNLEIKPQLAKLDDIERQIDYFRKKNISTNQSPAQHQSDWNKIRKLMDQYAELQYSLQKKIDPTVTLKGKKKYWQPRGMTWGHESDLGLNVSNARLGNIGSEYSDYLTTDIAPLTNYLPEIGPMNIGKRGRDKTVMESMFLDPLTIGKVKPEGLREVSKLYDQAGIRSVLPSLTGKKMILGKQDIGKQIDFLSKALSYNQAPFHGLNKKEMIEMLLGFRKLKDFGYNKGGVVNGYAAGGIGKLGVNILKKLAKKMPEDDFLRVMETLWKGVDPKKSGRYKQWAKNRWSPGYKWPYKKSRIKGPDIKKSHMADLSPGESVELQSKYADDIWEYKMKKKLGRPMDEDLEYPFLNPENEAFISTDPRTGLGRYQMRHFVDPENVGPVDKYQVYDWWDDILNKMRKKPKFKYVKDAKGKIVLKEVK